MTSAASENTASPSAPTESGGSAGASACTGLRLELLLDPNLPNGGPGRSIKGTGALTEFQLEAADSAHPDKVNKVRIASATADINLSEAPLEPKFDDKSGKRRVTGIPRLIAAEIASSEKRLPIGRNSDHSKIVASTASPWSHTPAKNTRLRSWNSRVR